MSRWWEELRHLVTGRVGRHLDLPDLRLLPSRRVTLQRTHFIVNDSERQHEDDRLYVLRREPRSRRDRDTVAVYSNGRGVGYLPDGIAREVAPPLDVLGGAAVVNGAGALRGSIRLRVDVPTTDSLREFARARLELTPEPT